MSIRSFVRLALIASIITILIKWNDPAWEGINPLLAISVAAVGILLTFWKPEREEGESTESGSVGAPRAPASRPAASTADDPYHKAHVLAAHGDYEGAVKEYQRAANQDRDNRRPIVEIVKICLDHLHQPDRAIQILEEAAARPGWSPNNHAFFLFRLVDLYLEHRSDQNHAVQLLREVIARYPDSRHSAHAVHKLREIDPSLVGPSTT